MWCVSLCVVCESVWGVCGECVCECESVLVCESVCGVSLCVCVCVSVSLCVRVGDR